MKRRMIRLGLSLIMGIGIWSCRLPVLAQAPAPEARPGCEAGCRNGSGDAQTGRSAGLRRLFHGQGIGCQENYDGACSSLAAELRFVFGSCRTFFREPCIPNPPHPGLAPRR
jgi:hypothetical protein